MGKSRPSEGFPLVIRFSLSIILLQNHLNRCSLWLKQQKKLPPEERASFFGRPAKRIEKRKAEGDQTSSVKAHSKKQQKQKTDNDTEAGVGRTLSAPEYAKFEELLAMHYFVTGSKFEYVEEPHLLAAFRILDPNIRLPSGQRLREIALECSSRYLVSASPEIVS